MRTTLLILALLLAGCMDETAADEGRVDGPADGDTTDDGSDAQAPPPVRGADPLHEVHTGTTIEPFDETFAGKPQAGGTVDVKLVIRPIGGAPMSTTTDYGIVWRHGQSSSSIGSCDPGSAFITSVSGEQILFSESFDSGSASLRVCFKPAALEYEISLIETV